MNRLVLGAIVAGALATAPCIPTSLTVPTTRAAHAQETSPQAATSDQIVASAWDYVGSPYATIGDSPKTGFSCIGFVHFIFAQNGVNVPYDIPMAWKSAPHVPFNELMPGDILFYSNTVFAGLSHVAIYIGNGQMIGADNFSTGVTVDSISDSYWMAHYTGATRPLALLGTAPTPAAQSVPPPLSTPTDTIPTNTPTPQPTLAPVQADAAAGAQLVATGESVGIFSGPGFTYTPITTVRQNVLLTVVQSQEGWYDVRFHDSNLGDTFGWVSAAQVHLAPHPVAAAPAFPQATPVASPAPPPFSEAAADSTTAQFVVLRGPLYVRSGPGKGFSPVGYVRKGTKLTVLLKRASWVRITTPSGLVGWVAAEYVGPESPPPVSQASTTSQRRAATTPALGTAHVKATVLNVRAAPSVTARVVTVVFSGETLTVIAQAKGWYEVRLRTGTVGWASMQWLVLMH